MCNWLRHLWGRLIVSDGDVTNIIFFTSILVTFIKLIGSFSFLMMSSNLVLGSLLLSTLVFFTRFSLWGTQELKSYFISTYINPLVSAYSFLKFLQHHHGSATEHEIYVSCNYHSSDFKLAVKVIYLPLNSGRL